MSYERRSGLVPFRDMAKLESAMKRANMNASELARLAGTTKQTISNLRRGKQRTMRTHTAEAIEEALRMRRGALFNYALVDIADRMGA